MKLREYISVHKENKNNFIQQVFSSKSQIHYYGEYHDACACVVYIQSTLDNGGRPDLDDKNC